MSAIAHESRLLLAGAVALALVGCRDEPTAPDIPEPSRAAVKGEGLPAPELSYYLVKGTLGVLWTWSDDQPWDLVAFEVVLDGRKIQGDWNVKPYARVEPGDYPIQSYNWTRPGYGETVPNLCVSVMAKNRSGKGSSTTTYHAENCEPVLTRPPGSPQLELRRETISAGNSFACGLSVAGEAYCWGRNRYGQVGDGTTTNRGTFVPVAGGHTFTQISVHGWRAGFDDEPGHACALTPAGAAYCWGHNGNGQLGDGTNVDRHVPTPVAGGLQFAQIDAGYAYTCGVTTAGAAYCWGYNAFGQLGDGTTAGHWTPQPVAGGLTFAQVSAGGRYLLTVDVHTCGVTTSGAAYCWGSNSSGQVGNGPHAYPRPDPITSPAPVSGGLTFRQVSAGGAHSCGVATSGAAYCWGYGLGGQVGTGQYSSPYESPAAVAGGLAFTRVSAGEGHTCALTTSGLAYCWGYNNDGELGNGTRTQSATPRATAGDLSYTQISAGYRLSCAVTAAGAGYCWGGSPSGATSPARTPAAIPRFHGLTAGSHHACASSPRGDAYCWGYNVHGQLGDGTTSNRSAGGIVVGGFVFTKLSVGRDHSCGLTATGSAYCWGDNFYGQLGDGTKTGRSEPFPVQGGLSFAELGAGDEHTCGRTSAGAVYCWGHNVHGQLGDGTTTDRLAPTPVTGGISFAQLATGDHHTCGLTSSGAAHCWGSDGVIQYNFPNVVSGGLSFTQLGAGDRFTCGLSGGIAYCWGANPDGQLGDGTTFNHPFPAPVTGGIGFAQISADDSHVCALTPAGAAYCWGWNYYGQLGDGTTTSRPVPTPVAGGFAFTTISAGGQFTCATDASESSYCWGANALGELGDGTTTPRSIPSARVIVWLTFRS